MVLWTNLLAAFSSPESVPARLKSPQDGSASWLSLQFLLFPTSFSSSNETQEAMWQEPLSVFKIVISLNLQIATRYCLNLWVKILIWFKKKKKTNNLKSIVFYHCSLILKRTLKRRGMRTRGREIEGLETSLASFLICLACSCHDVVPFAIHSKIAKSCESHKTE